MGKKYLLLFFVIILSEGCSILSSAPKRIESSKAISLSSAKKYIGKLVWPVKGAHVSSGFGARQGTFHEGIDITARKDTPVLAAHSGQVVYCNDSIRGYGKMIVLKASGLLTIYGHNDEFVVSTGDFVKAGDIIAYVGSTGEASSPHLHFETRVKDKAGKNVAVDPLAFFRR